MKNLINQKISDTLNKKERRKLFSLIRTRYPVLKCNLHLNDTEFLRKIDGDYKKKLMDSDEIISLYEKIGINEKEWTIHWYYYFDLQKSLHYMTKHNAKIERRDNKDYINYSDSIGSENRNKIRYPKKCRKTAWKRFYKLFPHLEKLK